MSVSSAISNFVRRERMEQRGNGHERLETGNPDENPVSVDTDPQDVSEDQEEDLEVVSLAGEEVSVENRSASEEEEDADHNVRARRTATLVELEEERELARRRTSACVLLAVFVLFRLWINAIQSEDFLMLMLCLIFTSWTARYIRYNREREEELDQRIAAYWNAEGSDSDVAEIPRSDLRMLSFQAQLALAIMESQRQMMGGGFGHPDGEQTADPGVSDEARRQWERYKHKSNRPPQENSNGSYGSVPQQDIEKGELGELPSCSICLGEYEDGESIVCLPCSHVYHEECVMSWTSNHVRCPLCNFDLESVSPTAPPPEESVV